MVALRQGKENADAAESLAHERSVAAAEEVNQRDTQRRMHPQSAADFKLIYSDLEAWRTKVGNLCVGENIFIVQPAKAAACHLQLDSLQECKDSASLARLQHIVGNYNVEYIYQA